MLTATATTTSNTTATTCISDTFILTEDSVMTTGSDTVMAQGLHCRHDRKCNSSATLDTSDTVTLIENTDLGHSHGHRAFSNCHYDRTTTVTVTVTTSIVGTTRSIDDSAMTTISSTLAATGPATTLQAELHQLAGDVTTSRHDHSRSTLSSQLERKVIQCW